jgi:hypothetical protein
MCAVAKRFLRRRAAAAERHSFFHREFVAVGVDQLNFPGHDVWTVLDCFNFYVSHDETLTHQIPSSSNAPEIWGAQAAGL